MDAFTLVDAEGTFFRAPLRHQVAKEKPWASPRQAVRASRQCRRVAVPEVLAPAALVLGTRVLRAEAAVYAGLAVVQQRLGDLR